MKGSFEGESGVHAKPRAMLWLGIQTELDALAEATGFGRL
jgi:hypothetical protein